MRISLPTQPSPTFLPPYLSNEGKTNPFTQNQSLSPYQNPRIFNSLWRQVHVPSASRFVETFKSPLLMGLALLNDKIHAHFFTNKTARLSILITAGGTKEPLDDVRYITNFSSGSLGRAFANIAAWRGHDVTLLAPASIEKQSGILHPGVRHVPFDSTASLQKTLETISVEKKWDLVLHSAAISDFTPATTAKGKIASKDHDELTIRLVKTPKLLASFRSWFSDAMIVGFKLLSGKSDDERLAIASEQISKYGTDFCFENDLTRLSKTQHEARLISNRGEVFQIPITNKFDVAALTLNLLEKRLAENRCERNPS